MKIRKLLSMVLSLVLGMVLISGCSSQTPFEIKDITMSEAASMMDEKQTFVLLFERDNCPFCNALNEYIEKTKGEHPNLTVYKVDPTSFELYREKEGDMTLISNTEDGSLLLERFPYYLYTPAIYQIKDGEPVRVGVGFDDSKGSVSIWDTTSTINWDEAKTEDVWSYIEAGQPLSDKSGEKTKSEDGKTDEDSKSEEDAQNDDASQEENPEEGEPVSDDASEAPVEGEDTSAESVSNEEWDGGSESSGEYTEDQWTDDGSGQEDYSEEQPETDENGNPVE